MSFSRFKLYYWPIPFRGCFVSYLMAYKDIPFIEETSLEEIQKIKALPPAEQEIPFMEPPILADLKTGRSLSQMPAIVLYLSKELELSSSDPFEMANEVKVVMDCNDLLMEVCRSNGATMWVREEWIEFRSNRLPKWLGIFEETLKRGFIGGDEVNVSDICVYALFGNMTRCLPDLEADLKRGAPGIYSLCEKIGAHPPLATFVYEQEKKYGNLYCGGQIEESIRLMLSMDLS